MPGRELILTKKSVPWPALAVAVALSGSCVSAAPPATAAPAHATDKAVLTRYCVGCHNSKIKTGGLAIEPAGAEHPGDHPEVWEKVVRRLRVRSMPPIGMPRPDDATYERLLASLETGLDAAAAVKPDPGRTDTFRRLNRTEYQNAIRDLLAVDVDVSSLLPSDEASHGFDNVTVGMLSPTLLERYLGAARKISRLALGRPLRSPGGDLFQLPPDLTQEDHFDELPPGTRGGAVFRYLFPVDAQYEVQIRLARDRNEHVEGLTQAHDVELLLDGERVRLFTVQPPPSGQDHSAVDQGLKAKIPVKAGPHQIAVTFPKKTGVLLESERQPWHARFNMDRHPRVQPALYSVSVNGPYDAKGAGDTPSRRRILVCHPAKPGEEDPCAQKILSTLMRRAYRRPVTAEDLRVPMKFYREGRQEGGFDAGLEMGLRAVLVSPEFLFRVERDPETAPAKTAYAVSDLELASRLSFFLWSSIPDEELLTLAARNKLRAPGVLEQQTRRMLADPRAEALVTNFAAQWLYLRNLSSAMPDMRLYPDFDDNLRRSFRKETELFLVSLLREDRSVLDLLRADYTYVNGRLAKHYGIPHIYDDRFRRVTFTDGSRGGLLRQGSVLMVTSYPTRTSPVLRGKWVLENLLGVPPPPPPPEVPALKETMGIGQAVSMRERMAQHRANPACAGCHQLMDPIGFALENYDAVGRWRAKEEGAAIDAGGSLPDGSKFDGLAGLQKALLNRPEVLVTTVVEKLLTYGLGRGVEPTDAPAIRRVLRDTRGQDYRLSAVVVGLVKSAPFQMRRAQ